MADSALRGLVDIAFHGPLFTPISNTAPRDAVQATVQELVETGEREVKLQLYPGHGLVTGHYRRSIHGEISRSLHGRVHDSRVVYGPWLEGVSSLNSRSRFKGYHAFRNAFQHLQRIREAVLARQVARLVSRLGG